MMVLKYHVQKLMHVAIGAHFQLLTCRFVSIFVVLEFLSDDNVKGGGEALF